MLVVEIKYKTMFVTEYEIRFFFICYIAVIVFTSIFILNDSEKGFKRKIIDLLLIFLVPVLGIAIILLDSIYIYIRNLRKPVLK